MSIGWKCEQCGNDTVEKLGSDWHCTNCGKPQTQFNKIIKKRLEE